MVPRFPIKENVQIYISNSRTEFDHRYSISTLVILNSNKMKKKFNKMDVKHTFPEFLG